MTKIVGVTGGGGVNFWASENLSGRVHFEGYSPEWRVLSKLSVQPCTNTRILTYSAIFFAFGLGINIVIDTDTLFYMVNMLSHTAKTGKKMIFWSVQHFFSS